MSKKSLIDEIEKAMSDKARTRVSSTSSWRGKTTKAKKGKKIYIPKSFSFRSSKRKGDSKSDEERIKGFLNSKTSDFEVEARFGTYQKIFPKTRGKEPWWRFDSYIKSGYAFSQLYNFLLTQSKSVKGGIAMFEEMVVTNDTVRVISDDFIDMRIRAVSDEDDTLYEEKKKLSYVDNTDWGIRISKSSEEYLGDEEGEHFEEIWETLMTGWEDTRDSPPIEYRFVGDERESDEVTAEDKQKFSSIKNRTVLTKRQRHRNSFTGQDGVYNGWRIDLTRVHEDYYRRDGTVFSLSKYEVEVERVKSVQYDSLMDVLEEIMKVMQNVTDVDQLMSLPERRLAVSEHNDLFWAQIKLDHWYQGSDKYKLYKNYWNRPRNIKLMDMLHPKFDPAVTIKLDGVRRFIYFSTTGVYMYSAPYDLYKIGDPNPTLTGTFIDCEYMDDEGNELFSFDILCWKNRNIMQQGFKKRLDILNGIDTAQLTENLWDIEYHNKQYFGITDVKPVPQKTIIKEKLDPLLTLKLTVLSDIVSSQEKTIRDQKEELEGRDELAPAERRKLVSLKNKLKFISSVSDIMAVYVTYLSSKSLPSAIGEKTPEQQFEERVKALLVKARKTKFMPPTREISTIDKTTRKKSTMADILVLFNTLQRKKKRGELYDRVDEIVSAYKQYVGGKKSKDSKKQKEIDNLLKSGQKELKKEIQDILSGIEIPDDDEEEDVIIDEHPLTFYDRVNEALDVSEEDFSGRTDGLIFQPWGPYQNRFTFKWKPVDRLTIDFLFSQMSPSEAKKAKIKKGGIGFWLMVVSDTFRKTINITETIGGETISLPKEGKFHPLKGKDAKVTKGTYKGHVGTITSVEKKGVRMAIMTPAGSRKVLFPRSDLKLVEIVEVATTTPSKNTVFTGSSIHPYAGYVVFNNKKETLGMNESIFECSWTGEEFKIERQRVDRDKPNNLRTSLDVWRDMMRPISEATIRGNTLQLTRKYMNMEKSSMLAKNFEEGDVVLDIGSGRGGDLRKWADIGFSRVFAVEPDKDNLEELKRRRADMLFGPDIITLDMGAEKTSKIEKSIKAHGGDLNGIVSFFSLTFFPGSDGRYEGLLDTLSLLPEGGKFVGIVQDGNRTRGLLEEHDGIYKNSVLSIEQEQHGRFTEDPIGNEIIIDVVDPTSMVKNQTEWLFYFVDFKDRMEKEGFRLVHDNFIEKGNEFNQLSYDAQAFVRLQRKFVFEKAAKTKTIARLAPPSKSKYGRLGKIGTRVLYYSVAPGNTYLGGVLEAVGDRMFENYSDKSMSEKMVDIMKLRREWADAVDMKLFSKLYGGRLKKIIEKKFNLTGEEALERYQERLRDKNFEAGEVYLLALISHFMEINVYTLRFMKNRPLVPFTVLTEDDCADFYTNDESVILVTSDLANYYTVSIARTRGGKKEKSALMDSKLKLVKDLQEKMCIE